MAPYDIRRYQDHDWETVRELFSKGMLENVSYDFWPILKKTRVILVFLGVPFAVVLWSGSLVLCLLSLFGLLAGLWLYFRHVIKQYVYNSLNTDLLDIQKSFLSGRDSSFWVAESEHQIVGIIGARPAKTLIGGGKYQELVRLSVKRSFRGKGMARTLVRTVLQFARDQGYDGVVLETTCSNHPAHRVYESLGFWKSHETGYYLNWWLGFLSVWHYQCDFSPQA
ncbi:N-acetyltransferase 8-like [Notamacropus eugenii]|uniref:N-acetyltransferase 8-like n=1 Tax=Notamacropus eugenii TaxID=9315 RepID=UPI003B66E428